MTDINTVTKADMTTADVFSCAHPNSAAVVGVNRHAADRVRSIILEDRLEGCSGIGGLPDVAGSNGDVPDVGIVLVNRDVGDPTGHEGRADAAKFQA